MCLDDPASMKSVRHQGFWNRWRPELREGPVHLGLFVFSALVVMGLGTWASQFHAHLFGLDEARVRQAMYVWLGHYKVTLIVFALVPYITLRLI